MSPSVRRCPFRHFPLREGWLQRELAEEIVPFFCTLDTGDDPLPVGWSPFSALTWIQPIKTSPYTASLTDLWLLGLELHRHFTRHALFPPTLSGEGIPALVGEQVSRCVTHLALVSLPRRVRETFVAQRLTTTTPPLPYHEVGGERGSVTGPFLSAPSRTTRDRFRVTWLSRVGHAPVQNAHISCSSPCMTVPLRCFPL